MNSRMDENSEPPLISMPSEFACQVQVYVCQAKLANPNVDNHAI
jgi:hypothetical protein